MALWHCPFCGTPQAMAARCWVCRRSSTTCSTCRHFRPSLAADLGYCAKDRARAPLTGMELRACWEEGARHATEPVRPAEPRLPRPGVARADRGPIDRPDPMRLRGFVPVDELDREPTPRPEAPATPSAPAPALPPVILAEPVQGWDNRTSLFGEADS